MDNRETLSPVDAAWLRLDEDVNTSDIVVLITFDDPLDTQRVRHFVRERFAKFPELMRRIEDPGGLRSPYWVDVPDFDFDDHIDDVALENETRAGLQDFVDGALTEALPRDRPLWRMWLVSNCEGGAAIVVKLHHCLGDGFALVGVLLTLCDNAPLPTSNKQNKRSSPSLGGQLWGELADSVRHPGHLVEAARDSARAAAALGELLLLSFDSPTSLRAPLSGVRHAAWSHGIALERFKSLAHDHGATVNDILLTVLAGALRRVLMSAGDDVAEAAIRSLIPVNLRPLEELGKELGNRFGLVFLDMPVATPTSMARLAEVRESMEKLKQSPQAVVAFGVLGAIGLAPEVIEHLATDLFSRKASLVVTNVPGPSERLILAGHPIDHIMFWVPHPARLGLGVSLLSYAGEVRIGVRADQAVMPRPEVLVQAFELELEALESGQ